jgi:hypothetical protein
MMRVPSRLAGHAVIEHQVWPPDMDVRTKLTMDRLVAMLWHELNERRFRSTDVAGLRARRERLANAFRNAAPWDAEELWARFAFPKRGDALARLFHYRLATATRRFLLDILRNRPHEQLEAEYGLEYEAEHDARLAFEESRRALREDLERLDRDCRGSRPPLRLTREPLNKGREFLRLQRELGDAYQSGSARRIAKARCEMAAFRWDSRREPFSSRKWDAYEEVTRLVKSAEWQLDRERRLLQRWRCQAWPPRTPMPETVRVGCKRQQQRVDAATAELAKLELRRTKLEDDILRPPLRFP